MDINISIKITDSFFATYKPWSKTIKINISVYVIMVELIIEPTVYSEL